MKKWFFTSPFFLICMIPFMPIAMFIFGCTIYVIITFNIIGITVLVIMSTLCIIFFRVIVYQSFTIIVLDDKGVKLYGVFGKIKDLRWEEIAFIGIGMGRGNFPEIVYYFVGDFGKRTRNL